jgi:nucleotide-binding universal stress UspA family protein
VVRGTPFDVLLTRSYRADMVVVGSFGRDAPAGLLVGPTALGFMARAGCPVAVVRGAEERLAPLRNGPVLVGVDGTSDSDPALRLGVELAAALGAELVAVHAWSDVRSDAAGGVHRASDGWTALADRAARSLDDQLDRVASQVAGVHVERRTVAGTPVKALLELAGRARVVVVAQRDRAPAAGMHLGSTSRGLVEFAPCPVVVARAGARGDRVEAADRGTTGAADPGGAS